jgi:beta-glucosidase
MAERKERKIQTSPKETTASHVMSARPKAPMIAYVEQCRVEDGGRIPGDQYVLFGARKLSADVPPHDASRSDLEALSDFSVSWRSSLNPIRPTLAGDTSWTFAKVLLPDGTAIETGCLSCHEVHAEGGTDFLNFRITNATVTSFAVWVLAGASGGNSDANARVALRANNGTPVGHATPQKDSRCGCTRFAVENASRSDLFTLAIHGDGKGPLTLSGLAFSAMADSRHAGETATDTQEIVRLDLKKNGVRDLYKDPAQPIERRVDDLLGRMTLEEKAGQLNQQFSEHTIQRLPDLFPDIRAGRISSFIWGMVSPGLRKQWMMGSTCLRNQLQRVAVQESRLGIPIMFGMDIIHGASTVFPSAIGLACAFEPLLFERAQAVAAREARALGIDWSFAPMCDMARDPRWGRVVETCGEDPHLSSLCNAAQVRGLQGDNMAAADKVAACLKHYVGYSAVTGGRDKNGTDLDEWSLQNTHLPPFRAGIAAGAMTLMSGFNEIDGIPAAASHHALTEILRGQLNFGGFVVSDWGAVGQMIKWGYARDLADAARLALPAGNDMDMYSKAYVKHVPSLVRAGDIPPEVLDEAVRRVLRVKFMLGLFDRPYTDEAASHPAQLHPDAIAIARECAAKSVVLLKNDGGVLPVAPGVRKIALIGPLADDAKEMLGSWNGYGEWGVSLAAGLKARFPDTSITVVKGCDVSTTPRIMTLQDGSVVPDDSVPPDTGDLDLTEALAAAQAAELVIMAVGEPRGWTGEGGSRVSLSLGGNQQALFDAVAAAGKPMVSIVFSGRPLVLPELWKASAAVLYAWQPGCQAGPGLADLLAGDVSPGARLSMSVPADIGQVPIYYNHYRTGLSNNDALRFRDSGLKQAKFWFGYGLTYTTFAYGDVSIVPAEGGRAAEAVATVTNVGAREGEEVVQLYVGQCYCHEGVRPLQELRGFKRIALKAGEAAVVRFPLTDEVLGYFDRKGKFKVDASTFQVWIAPHAHTGTPATYTTDLAPRAADSEDASTTGQGPVGGCDYRLWRIVSVSFDSPYDNSGEAGVEKLLDNNPGTYWQTYHEDRKVSAPPHEVVFDMGREFRVAALTMTPRLASEYFDTSSGMPDRCEFHLSLDGRDWTLAAKGDFPDIKANPCMQVVHLETPMKARYLRFVATHVVADEPFVVVAGIGAIEQGCSV